LKIGVSRVEMRNAGAFTKTVRDAPGQCSSRKLFHQSVEIFVDNAGTTSALPASVRAVARVPVFEATAS